MTQTITRQWKHGIEITVCTVLMRSWVKKGESRTRTGGTCMKWKYLNPPQSHTWVNGTDILAARSCKPNYWSGLSRTMTHKRGDPVWFSRRVPRVKNLRHTWKRHTLSNFDHHMRMSCVGLPCGKTWFFLSIWVIFLFFVSYFCIILSGVIRVGLVFGPGLRRLILNLKRNSCPLALEKVGKDRVVPIFNMCKDRGGAKTWRNSVTEKNTTLCAEKKLLIWTSNVDLTNIFMQR